MIQREIIEKIIGQISYNTGKSFDLNEFLVWVNDQKIAGATTLSCYSFDEEVELYAYENIIESDDAYNTRIELLNERVKQRNIFMEQAERRELARLKDKYDI